MKLGNTFRFDKVCLIAGDRGSYAKLLTTKQRLPEVFHICNSVITGEKLKKGKNFGKPNI